MAERARNEQPGTIVTTGLPDGYVPPSASLAPPGRAAGDEQGHGAEAASGANATSAPAGPSPAYTRAVKAMVWAATTSTDDEWRECDWRGSAHWWLDVALDSGAVLLADDPRLLALVEAARKHQPVGEYDVCAVCDEDWPCETARALAALPIEETR